MPSEACQSAVFANPPLSSFPPTLRHSAVPVIPPPLVIPAQAGI
ncbi:TPA: hypothetical protein ACFNM3_002096 [Neisseria lactamica]